MRHDRGLNRRQLLQTWGLGLLASPLTSAVGCRPQRPAAPAKPTDEAGGEQLLEEIERTAFDYFWTEASPETGLVRDRAAADGDRATPAGGRAMASIAATGFGLAGLCIGDRRGYRDARQIADRVRATLRHAWHDLPNEHGFWYHFVDVNTGRRWDRSELSSIDSAILLCGVLTARQHFADPEIRNLATRIYERVDWPWMLNGGRTFSMGWLPDKGFLDARWDHYCELMMIYLLAVGSPTHPVPPDTWHAWTRPKLTYQGIEYVSGNDPLFTHQYSHAWYDFRDRRDRYADYFDNSARATRAHKLFCLSLRDRFPTYGEDLWGITASDSVGGYTAWGGPPPQGPIDGTVVPCAAGGSLPFLPDDCARVLRHIRAHYPRAWGRYGFVDAFNPLTGWYNPDVIGIDVGITMLMAENHRTGFVWETFMKNPETTAAMRKVGFRKAGEP